MMALIDPHGRLLDPEFHDGLLLGIALSPDRQDLTLLCRIVDGKDFNLVIPQIARLRVEHLLQGNIIFKITIRQGDRCSPQGVQWVFDYDDDEARRYLLDKIREITDNGWTVLEISTSYGCELAALSKARADKITIS